MPWIAELARRATEAGQSQPVLQAAAAQRAAIAGGVAMLAGGAGGAASGVLGRGDTGGARGHGKTSPKKMIQKLVGAALRTSRSLPESCHTVTSNRWFTPASWSTDTPKPSRK